MTIKEIIEKYSTLRVSEKRGSSRDYDERVFYNEDIDKWNKIFFEIFGAAAKPAGAQPTDDDLNLTENYGGIQDNQTLFKKEFDDAIVVVMLWPWQDDVHTTLKTALLKK